MHDIHQDNENADSYENIFYINHYNFNFIQHNGTK